MPSETEGPDIFVWRRESFASPDDPFKQELRTILSGRNSKGYHGVEPVGWPAARIHRSLGENHQCNRQS
jgi:hypothetical protein